MFNLSDLIYPLFVKDGTGLREEVPSMPDIFRFSPDTIIEEVHEAAGLGIGKILVFGIPGKKDETGSAAYEEDNIVSRAVKTIKRDFPRLLVMTDVCLCAYTTHGHCGILKSRRSSFVVRRSFNAKDILINNEATLKALCKIALSHAGAGADYVAPSAMADGQVRAIRKYLDKNGFKKTKIIGYSAKFASNFYGPFRDMAQSAPAFGDRSAYQLDFRRRGRAIKEIADDIKEGADIVMVKPALAYLDIIKEISTRFDKPLAAYNVSGEYAMIKYGAKQSFWDEKKIIFEVMTAIKRAGADLVITYHAKDIARWLKEK